MKPASPDEPCKPDTSASIEEDAPPLAWQDARMFYLAPEAWHAPYMLKGQEAHHASRVLRLHAGDDVRLIDGHGTEGVFRIASMGKDRVDLTLLRIWTHPAPSVRTILAAGWTKAARRGWILEKAVEFEAAGIWLWQADHSQFSMPDDIKTSWQGPLIAGAKQCRNPWLPELRTLPNGVNELIQAAATCQYRYALLESDHRPAQALTPERMGLPGTTIYVVGPEGGFSPREVEALHRADFLGLSLGQRVLRWETAALLCLGLHWWKGQLTDISTHDGHNVPG